MFAIYWNRALCVAVNILNKSTMARNSEPDTVIKSSDVGGAVGGIGGVVGRSVEVAWGIDGAVGADGIEYVGRSSCMPS